MESMAGAARAHGESSKCDRHEHQRRGEQEQWQQTAEAVVSGAFSRRQRLENTSKPEYIKFEKSFEVLLCLDSKIVDLALDVGSC
ncbi:hypothetical protein E3N88_36300 [Mikania micrantha]|uniref:Uncharacterized protein n=1 Tax=Mikania micrantha TaxID=192012 RepID=A0A5N6M3B1_9ASTR|nr:hypothetical protein E3N88_36300 [Mikania micrantha]